MSKFRKYTLKHKLGTVGDLATEWMSAEEYEKFWKEHKKHVEELKEKGDYLKEVEVDYYLEEDPLLDSYHKKSNPTESYKFEIINIGNETRKI